MPLTRWAVMGLVVPAIAALGIACDRTTPTENLRPGAADAAASFNHSDDGDDDRSRLRAVPFVFIGRTGDCGTLAGAPYPAGSRIVTSAWLGGMGLPDNGGPNSGPIPFDNPNKNDPRLGLLLSKNGPTPDCASSGARILGVRGMEVGPVLTLGFDYRNGGHCGGGAPRFNVTVREPDSETSTFLFVGNCATGVTTPADQDLTEWSRVRFATPVPPGTRLESISIVYDEGTDNPIGTQDPHGIGLAVIDNIFIDGQFIRRGRGIATDRGDGDDDRRDRD